jgi:tripartite-type tricarboxylate transporter receptor subunit TctC
MNKTSMTTRREALKQTAALAALAATGGAHAQVGGQVIKMVVPFAAASYTDNIARLIAPSLSDKLGQTIVIENRAGANGVIGANYVAKAPPDGLTILVGGASLNSVNPSVYKTLPYDPVKDLLPVARIGMLPFMLVVNPSLPITNVAELIAYARKNPGKLAYGAPNAATLVGMEVFKRNAGIDITSVPYKASPQAITDLVGNTIQVMIADFAIAMPQVRARKLRMIAVTMKDRSPLLPDVPPMAEQVRNFDISAWTGLFLPGEAPPAMANRIYEALQSVLASAELRAKFASIGFDVLPLGPVEFGAYVRSDIKAWAGLVNEAGVKPE